MNIIFKNINAIVKEIIKFFKKATVGLLKKMWEKFLGLNLSGKIIILNTIPAFFAIILPVTRFKIFDSNFPVNNPFAVHLIGIIILMFAAEFFNRKIKLAIRLAINLYYLFWIIYTPLAGGLTKAQPHEIIFGYYLNIAVPLIYIGASVYNYFEDYS